MTCYGRADFERAGIDPPQFEKIWSVTNPTLLAPHCQVQNILMIGGKFDEVVPSKFTVELWEALWRPCTRRYP